MSSNAVTTTRRNQTEIAPIPANLPSTIQAMAAEAEILVASGLLPDSVDTWQKAVAIMSQGREFGWGTWASFRNINIIKGRPTISAAGLAGIIQQYHGDNALVPVETTGDHATYKYKRREWAEYQVFTFTLDMARQAGLLGKGGPWQQYPAAMLRSRCISFIAQTAFQAECSGILTPEEMGASVTVRDDGSIDVVAHEPTRPVAIREVPSPTDSPRPDGPDATVVDRETGEIVGASDPRDKTGPITTAQRERIKAILAEIGEPSSYANRIAKATFGNPVADLSLAEAGVIIDKLLEVASIDSDGRASLMRKVHAVMAEKLPPDGPDAHYALKALAASVFPQNPESMSEWTSEQLEDMVAYIESADGQSLAEDVQAAMAADTNVDTPTA